MGMSDPLAHVPLRLHHLTARGISAAWEIATGHLPHLVIGGAPVLHSAPWRDEAAIQGNVRIPPVDRRLGGTFVCAPFGRDDVDAGPPHGRPANGRWCVIRAAPGAITASRTFPRGTVTARIVLRDGHPVLYQTHVLALSAPCTFAHHPMFRFGPGARLSMPTPRRAVTFDPSDPGAERFLPRQSIGGFALKGADGRTLDLRDPPDAPCEDFAALVDGGAGIGWTALARTDEGDTILLLRRREVLPLTCLWWSNGGRTGAPWNGRHRGVIGIEHAICAGADGLAAALAHRGAVAEAGVPTALPPGRHVIAHAILRLPGVHEVRGVEAGPDELEIATDGGPLTVPFDTGHLA